MDPLGTSKHPWAPTVGPLGLLIQLLWRGNFFVFWAISKISKPTSTSGDYANNFLTLLTLLGTSGHLWDPWAVEVVPSGAYLNTLEG